MYLDAEERMKFGGGGILIANDDPEVTYVYLDHEERKIFCKEADELFKILKDSGESNRDINGNGDDYDDDYDDDISHIVIEI